MNGDVDGALNVPHHERMDRPVVWNIEPLPERPGWQGVASTLIHDALNEAMMHGIAREQEVATTAIKLGVGYARIQTWTTDDSRVDYVITSLVPPMERFEFPNWSSFEVWRGHQERRRG